MSENVTVIIQVVKNNEYLGNREAVVSKELYDKMMAKPKERRGLYWKQVIGTKEEHPKATQESIVDPNDDAIEVKKRRKSEVSNG